MEAGVCGAVCIRWLEGKAISKESDRILVLCNIS